MNGGKYKKVKKGYFILPFILLYRQIDDMYRKNKDSHNAYGHVKYTVIAHLKTILRIAYIIVSDSKAIEGIKILRKAVF